ncbi:MAG: sigma-70 family RNA polymerase sigma factor [Verrucomicrobia bacterium]|nr:sigma-70 family RNA polymerase sigma factor [Verrucomicrobiota bacterium]
MPLDPDAELMVKVRRGSRAAFETLMTKYHKPVINMIFQSISDPVEAEDLAQNVFLQIWKTRSRYKPTAKFSTWLFTIARNMCLNEVRRRARHRAESLDQPPKETADGTEQPLQVADPTAMSADDAALRGELHKQVEAALRTLPEVQRTAMMLLRHKEMPYEDIAKVLGCSLSATKSIIHRARETLRARLKPYLRP